MPIDFPESYTLVLFKMTIVSTWGPLKKLSAIVLMSCELCGSVTVHKYCSDHLYISHTHAHAHTLWSV